MAEAHDLSFFVVAQHAAPARKIFRVVCENELDGGYHIFCPSLPGCHTQSETVEQGLRNIREAIELYVDTLIEDGLPIP